MIKINNFLSTDTYKELKAFSQTCDFAGEINPIDGVLYPDINAQIPLSTQREVLSKLAQIKGKQPENVLMFLRMSKEGVEAPHMFHHDLSHGANTFMLYLNTHQGGGTVLARHWQSGIAYAPGSDVFVEIVKRDMNEPYLWEGYDKAEMVENSAALFDAGLFHCAFPIGGFGKTQKEARIVFTCFFS